jgi:hypothetical protein
MKIKLTESKLKQIVAESVKKILSEARKPSDKTVGKHTLKGLRYDKNGNPLYTSDTMSDDEKKNQGWKFSKKHGMYGQLSDPTKLSESSTDINESISTDYHNTLKQLLAKSFNNLNENEKQFLYDLINNEPWETIYIALGVLESNRINESRKKREPRKGTIELNGKHIDAVEDGLDKNGNPMYKVNDPSIKGRRCKDGSIRVQHYNFKPNRVNEGSDVLNEIGDTLKGQFALGAVRGRASARPRYQNNKYGGLHTKSQQDNIANNAADASWENRKDLDINKSREMNNAEQRGYYYGFEKGMTN